jgi:hypothetical protein
MLDVLRTNISAPEIWFANMNAAAISRNVSIQLCMPLPFHFLHSTSMYVLGVFADVFLALFHLHLLVWPLSLLVAGVLNLNSVNI